MAVVGLDGAVGNYLYEALCSGFKIRCAEACAASSSISGVIPETVEPGSAWFLGDPLAAEFKEGSCARSRHGCSSFCVMKASMAVGRYQAEPRFPLTQATCPVLRAASSLDFESAGQRFSTSASDIRASKALSEISD